MVARPAVLRGREFLESTAQLLVWLAHWRNPRHAKWCRWCAINLRHTDGLEVWQFGQVLSSKNRRVALNHNLCISRTNSAGNGCTNVTKDRLAQFFLELCHKLVSQDQTQAILTRFTENRLEAIGGKVLELINIECEVLALVLGDIGPSHRSRLELHDEDNTKQLRVEITHLTFGEVNKQNLVVIHNLREVKATLGLANDVAHCIVADEWAKLRDHPTNQVTSFVGALRGRELLRPKVEHLPIELGVAELLIHQQLWHINKRTARRVSHQQQRTVTEDVLEAWPNDTGVAWVVQAIEHVNRLLHQEVLLVGVVELKHIEANWVAHITWVEVDNILYPIAWYFSKQRLSQVTVRINQGKTPPRQHILVCQVLLQDRLTTPV